MNESSRHEATTSQKKRWSFDTREEAGYAYDIAVFELTGLWTGTNQDLGLLTTEIQMSDQTKLSLKGKPAPEMQVKLDKVAATYVKIRDKRSELKKEYEDADLKLKAQLETLESFCLETLQALGVESARTKYGTVYKSLALKPSCEDWTAFYAWIAENDAFDALEKRVKKSFIVDYMADNADELPTGITVLREWEVTIRRK
jgi:hypothetical protein